MKVAVKGNIVRYLSIAVAVIVISALSGSYYVSDMSHRARAQTLLNTQKDLNTKLSQLQDDYTKLKNADQKVRNDKLEEELKNIQKTYKETITAYEDLLKLKTQTNKTDDFDKRFAQILSSLSDKDYASASAQLTALKSDIDKKQAEITASFQIPANVPTNNNAPGSGYQRQVVQNEFGTYMVDVIAADLHSTKVVVDTASDGTCKDNCPVMALGDYAARSGAFAAVNGPYFCPASYPSCAGKTNSFDTLLMNKNKVYFNSDNNVYSNVPAVIFSAGGARYVGRSLEWGRDTGVDSVIANQPLLVAGGNVVFGGDNEVKRSGKGTRAFIGSTGSTAYMGVVYNANTAEMARVLHTMGIQNALNLDSGGSIALWSNGRYLAGPGRALPFGVLFVRR